MNFLRQVAFYAYSVFLALNPTQAYTEGVVGQPVSFFPSHAVMQNDKTISKLIYRGLFKYDIYGNLIPDLAESWAISDKNVVYTVKLKPNQFWSDGSQITADDLIYTAFKTPDLLGVATDKIDTLTVRYTLPNEFSPFLTMLTTGVMQNNSLENFDPLRPVSSGPFRVVRIVRNGPVVKDVVLANPTSSGAIRKIVFKYYSTEAELVTAAKLGEIQGFLAKDKYPLENFVNYKFPLQGVYFALFFNLSDQVVGDIKTRRGLASALDLEKLISEEGIFVQGPISRSQYTVQDLKFKYYDSTTVSDLSGLELTITLPDMSPHKEVAQRIKAIWGSELDLDVKLNKVAPEAFDQTIIEPRAYQILLYGQEISRDPDRYINWHSTQGASPGLNLSLFNHVRADRALEEGRKALDGQDRAVHYKEFQKVVVEQIPALFLYHPYRNFYVKDTLSGIGEKYTFSVEDRFLDFTNWKFGKATN